MVKISDMTEKEVINIRDGSRVGIIDDVEVDLDKGIVTAIVIPAPGKIFNFFGKNQDLVIAWKDILKIGIDIILVDLKEVE
ncbi:MAG: Sporulation protein, YlmC/YmxH family [Sporanaerobacter sp.]|jgi:YlmC/YmxH family sporulation protein|uniref:YlmC/YmxH family sporulation protein n=1 Tax=Sporanaerobacter sp. TaxID=2010183 RepID=UPI003A102362